MTTRKQNQRRKAMDIALELLSIIVSFFINRKMR